MKTTILGPIAALVIGGAGGFFAGQKSTPVSDQDSETLSDVRAARRSSTYSGSENESSRHSSRVKSAKQAMSLPGQNNRLEALMSYYAGLNISEFADEAKKLEDLPWSERMMVGYLLFARWGEEDPTAAIAYTKTMGFAGRFVSSTVMQSWAAKYPQDAAAYYTQNVSEFSNMGMMGGGGRRGAQGAASVIAAEWARQDSAGALAWAQGLEGNDQRQALRGIVKEVAKEDLEEAAGMLVSITDDEARKEAQNSIAREWGKQSWVDAKGWIATLPVDDQQGATALALRGLAGSDPLAAAANITSLTEGKDRDEVVEDIAFQWSKEAPSDAAAWLMESGSPEAQAKGVGRVVSTWVGEDAEAAYSFVSAQPEGDVRDGAVSSYVIANQGGDVQQNLTLAETIGSNRNRDRAITVTAMGWLRSDKEAATEYIESTDALSDNAKQRITRFAEGGGRRGGRR